MSESTIGGFELIEKIGEGGMGSVIKARQVSLDRIVALKLLPPRLVSTQHDIDQFIREARAAAKLKHEGLAQIYEAGESDGVYYFAMEFIDGHDIHHMICEQGGIPEKEALKIAECVASALDHAWTNEGIIHRDIKPSNILVAKNGGVKLIDLGIVKVPGETSDATQNGDMLGTPHYCSPEQAEGQKLDCRSDIYGLGATLYHMVTGERPFGDADGAGALVQQVTSQLPDPRNINPALSAKVVKLISIMMAKQAGDRHVDWKEVIKDIKRVSKGKYPLRQPQAGFASTVNMNPATSGKRISDRNARRTSTSKRAKAPSRGKSSPLPIIIALSVIGIAGLIMMLTLSSKNKRLAEAERLNMWAASQLEAIEEYHVANPNKYDEAATAFRKLATNSNMPHEYRTQATDRAAAMKARKKLAIERTIKAVENNVSNLLARDEFIKALAVCKQNNGSFASYTENTRKNLIKKIEGKKRAKETAEKIALEKEEAQRLEKENIEKARLEAIEREKRNTPPELIKLTEGYEKALAERIGTPAEATLKTQYIKMLGDLQRKLTLEKKVEQALVVGKKKTAIDTAEKARIKIATALKESLVLAYNFNEYTDGSIADSSTNKHHATSKNVAWTSACYRGGGYTFNGTDSEITGPDWTTLNIDNEITIDLCIKFTDRMAIRRQATFMSVASPDGQSFGIHFIGSSLRLNFGGKYFRFDGITLNHDTWHNLIIVAKESDAVVYLDGIAGSPQYPVNHPEWPPSGPLKIGTAYRRIQGNADYIKVMFKGLMDEVKLYNKAFEVGMVKQIYAANKK